MSTIKQLEKDIKREYERWQHEFKHGCSDPSWPDGANLNLLRAHIISYRRRANEIADNLPQIFSQPLPPLLSATYMVVSGYYFESRNELLKSTFKLEYSRDGEQLKLF